MLKKLMFWKNKEQENRSEKGALQERRITPRQEDAHEERGAIVKKVSEKDAIANAKSLILPESVSSDHIRKILIKQSEEYAFENGLPFAWLLQESSKEEMYIVHAYLFGSPNDRSSELKPMMQSFQIKKEELASLLKTLAETNDMPLEHYTQKQVIEDYLSANTQISFDNTRRLLK